VFRATVALCSLEKRFSGVVEAKPIKLTVVFDFLCRWLSSGGPEVDASNQESVFCFCLTGELPLAYVAWLFYSAGLLVKVWTIYGPWYEVRAFFWCEVLRENVQLKWIKVVVVQFKC